MRHYTYKNDPRQIDLIDLCREVYGYVPPMVRPPLLNKEGSQPSKVGKASETKRQEAPSLGENPRLPYLW